MSQFNSPKLKKNALYLLASVTPFVCAEIILLGNGFGLNLTRLIPVWNDEVGWWLQVRDVVSYNKPLGYFGYNGTHAAIGTFGPWGVAPLLPYALFGRVFGWKIYSMSLANLVFLSCSLFLFCILTKPNQQQTLWLGGLYACSYITVGYSVTAMSEGLRYAIGIVLSGIAIWLRQNVKKTRKAQWHKAGIYLLIFVFLFYAVNVYLIFALMAFVYCWLIIYKARPVVRAIVSMSGMIIIAAIAFKLVSDFSAPYTQSTIGTVLMTLREQGLYRAAGVVINGFLENIQTVSWFHIINQDSDILQLYFFEYILIIITLLWRVITRLKEKTVPLWDSILDGNCMLALVMLLGFLIGYCTLYTGSDWTLCRGTNTALMMSFCFLSVDNERIFANPKDIKINIKKAILIVTFLGMVCIWNYHHAIAGERDRASMRIELIDAEKSFLSKYIKVTEEVPAWDNTIACYGAVDNLYLAIPDGAGMNYMIFNANNELARYVLFKTSEEKSAGWVRMLQDSGHRILYKDDVFTVLEKDSDLSADSP